MYFRTPLLRYKLDTDNPGMHEIRISGFLFENKLHWQFAVQQLLFTVCTNFYPVI